jgi:hypothetical protein
MDIPVREYVVEPFLPMMAAMMIFAWRGLGKTWLAMELALSVALGKPFLGYKVPYARNVLYVDGETILRELRDRLLFLCPHLPSNLFLLSSEQLCRAGMPLVINQLDTQRRIDELLREMLERKEYPQLIIFDNLSALTYGLDENDNTAQDSLLRWIIHLRHRGISVVLIHHSNKDGDQRGASRREDVLDTSIGLFPPIQPDPQAGAQFTLEFTKTRGLRPVPDRLDVKLFNRGTRVEWQFGPGRRGVPETADILRIIRDDKPESQKALSDLHGVTPSQMSKKLRRAKDQRLVVIEKGKPPRLTEEGLEFLGRFYPTEEDFQELQNASWGIRSGQEEASGLVSRAVPDGTMPEIMSGGNKNGNNVSQV